MKPSATQQGTWEVRALLGEGQSYAFLVQWVQELCIRGQSLVAMLDAPLKEDIEAAKAAALQSGETGAAVDEAEDALGDAEMLAEVVDLSCFVAEAAGAILRLTVRNVDVVGVEARAADARWDSVHFQRTTEPQSHGEQDGERDVWVANALHCEREACDVRVLVTRRDWRIDPRSLAVAFDTCTQPLPLSGVSREPSRNLRALGGGGARVRSILRPLPQKAAPFRRRSDAELIFYELHLGSFTPDGTLQAAAAKLPYISDLGVSALSLMPVHQDSLRLKGRSAWGYDPLSLFAVDTWLGSCEDLVAFVEQAHDCGLAVVLDFVANHFAGPVEKILGPRFFHAEKTRWGPRPNFEVEEVRRYILEAVELFCGAFGFDGVRIDSTKSMRKHRDGAPDPAGALLLGQITHLCRSRGWLAVAEDLEDGDGVLQMGGLGFHLQWDMAHFCQIYHTLVNPDDRFRDLEQVAEALRGLAPARGHPQRGRVIFTENHDTAPSDRYGRIPLAVYNGKAFMCVGEDASGDAFQHAATPHGTPPCGIALGVEGDHFSQRRTALGLVLLFTSPGVPMLLQGQETLECQPFTWPTGPPIVWERVTATEGPSARVRALVKRLTALRLGPRGTASWPFRGDGLHVFHAHEGVLAYLRWADVDSRDVDDAGSALALTVMNFTCQRFPQYELGVPPSDSWRVIFCTENDKERGSRLPVVRGIARHGFPSTLVVELCAYSAVVLLRCQ